MPFEIRPEQFATGPQTDWAAAFQRALIEAKASRMPIVLDGAKTYSIGSPRWDGLTIDGGHIDIIGNGATLKLAAQPATGWFGRELAMLRATNTHGIRLRDLKIDLNKNPAGCFGFTGCNDIMISGCEAFGHSGTLASHLIFALGGSGLVAQGNYAHDLDFMFRTGHTNGGTEFDNVTLSGNRARNLNADFLACVGKNYLVEGNSCDGLYTGVALSGYDAFGTTCSDIAIIGNTFRGMKGQGIQTDFVKTPKPDVTLRNIRISSNHFEASDTKVCGAYIYGTDGLIISGNIFGTPRGISLFDVSGFTIADNVFGGCTPGGIMMHCNAGGEHSGSVRDGVISGNSMTLGPGAVAIEATSDAAYELHNVAICNNMITSGARGIVLLGNGHVGCKISGNTISRMSQYDLRCESQDVDVEGNSFLSDGGSANAVEWPLPAPVNGVVNVPGRRLYRESYSTPTAISGLSQAVIGKPFTIRATSNRLKLVQGSLQLKGGQSVTLAPGNIITFMKMSDGQIYEISRNF